MIMYKKIKNTKLGTDISMILRCHMAPYIYVNFEINILFVIYLSLDCFLIGNNDQSLFSFTCTHLYIYKARINPHAWNVWNF